MKTFEGIEYTIKRSRRRSYGLEVVRGRLIVKAPAGAGENDMIRVLTEKRAWIEKNLARSREEYRRAEDAGLLTDDDIRMLSDMAVQVIPQKVEYYADKIGVHYGRITIRNQRTKWGSCSSRGNLNFNCLLMLCPDPVIDSVVVHELCHLKEMNHSERFYREVLKAFPDYRKCDRWLKENGAAIMLRMTAGRK